MGRKASLGLLVLALLLTPPVPADAECNPSVPTDAFQYRFGIAPGFHDDASLLRLLKDPTPILIEAVPAPRNDAASTIATIETHVLYPTTPSAMMEVLQDAESLAGLIPDLAVHETICRDGSNMIKQIQRTEFSLLFLTFGTEYLIDVHYALNGPDEYLSYWGMYESLDDKLAFQYGSWYFQSVEIGGREYTYVRHFSRNGVKTRVPGLRLVIERSAEDRATEMLDSIYEEAVNRHGTTPIASTYR